LDQPTQAQQPQGADTQTGNQIPKKGYMPLGFQLVQALAGGGNGQLPSGPLNLNQQPARPTSRLDAFENFLGQFLDSFSKGMAASGTGPAANARGFGTAVQAPYQQQLQQYQLGQQQQAQQAQVGEAQARTGLIGAQTQGEDITNQINRNRLLMMGQMGQGGNPFAMLGPLSQDEQAVANSATQEARYKGDPMAINQAVDKITSMRAISGRMAGASTLIPDKAKDSQTGWTKRYYNRDGSIARDERNAAPPPSMVPQITQTQDITTDAQGNRVAVPKTSIRSPNIPGAQRPALPAPGQAQPITGPNGQPLHGQMPEAARQTKSQIDFALGLSDVIKPDLEAVAADIGRGGNLGDASKIRSAWEQYSKLGIDPANVDPNSIVSMMPTVDPRLARLMPAIAMMQIVGAQPYLRNVRNFNYVQMVQQHLPNPATDTPQMIVSKLRNMNRTLPMAEVKLLQSEGLPAQLDQNMVKRYVDLAGGDRAKARVMAVQDGWSGFAQ
jgi:hypothetical protein